MERLITFDYLETEIVSMRAAKAEKNKQNLQLSKKH